MLRLTTREALASREHLIPEAPGPLVALHVIHSGNGSLHADRWPEPRVLIANSGGNISASGDPDAVALAELRPYLSGIVDAPDGWVPLLQAAFPDLVVWERVIQTADRPIAVAPHADRLARRLAAEDAERVAALSHEIAWISNTWGGPAGLAGGGYAWGAFAEQRLVAVACSFFVGARYEDIGVVTEPEYRGRGLSLACATGLCRDIVGRGHVPSWTTTPDNAASLAVARRLGFQPFREARLYLTNLATPV